MTVIAQEKERILDNRERYLTVEFDRRILLREGQNIREEDIGIFEGEDAKY
jgi:hypothetical protein